MFKSHTSPRESSKYRWTDIWFSISTTLSAGSSLTVIFEVTILLETALCSTLVLTTANLEPRTASS